MAVFNRVRSVCMQRCRTHFNSWKVWKQLNHLKRRCNYADINSVSCSDSLRTQTKTLTVVFQSGKMRAGQIFSFYSARLSMSADRPVCFSWRKRKTGKKKKKGFNLVGA